MILNYLLKNIRSFLLNQISRMILSYRKILDFPIDYRCPPRNNSLVWKFEATRIALTPAWENWQGTKKLGAIARRILLAAETRGYFPDLGYFRRAIEARFEREIGFSTREARSLTMQLTDHRSNNFQRARARSLLHENPGRHSYNEKDASRGKQINPFKEN